MPISLGRGTAVGFGQETTFGTAVSRTNWIKALSVDLEEQQNVETVPHLFGAGSGDASFAHQVDTDVTLEGTLVVPLMYDGVGLLLQAIGGAAVTSTGSGPYEHTYNTGATDYSHTIEVVRGSTGNSEIFVGVRYTRARIILAPNAISRLEVDFIGQKANAARSSAGTPSFTAFNESNLKPNIVMGHEGAGISWNSGSFKVHSRITITIDNQYTAVPCIGSKYADEIVRNDFRTITFEVERMNDGDTLYNAALAFTQSDWSVAFTGTGNRTATITGRNAVIQSDRSELSAAGPTQERVTWQAFADDSDPAFTIVIDNDSSSGTAN